MIKNVVFDIGNVLAGFVWQEFFQSFGYAEEILVRLAKATVMDSFWNECDRGELTDEELLQGFIRHDPGIEKEIREVFSDITGMIKRFDYAKPWIQDLKSRGYHVYVISNFSRQAYAQCRDALDFLQIVDGAILSFQEKMVKPQVEIYQLLCDRFELKPEECVFLDDVEKNIEGAKKAGMKAILFHTREQAAYELEELLTVID